jgi:FkbM family methyltransferase
VTSIPRKAAAGLLRLYTRHTPVARGKYRLATLARRLLGTPPRGIVRTRDGRRLYADLASGMCDGLYFHGEYEAAISRLVRGLVRPGDVCIDVGANFGWYTTLLADLVGSGGSVHAFEPVPDVFAWLQDNLRLAGEPRHVHLVRAADGERASPTVTLYVFADLPIGHTSMHAAGHPVAATASAPMCTLDDHVIAHNLGPVAFVKVDVEGAELGVLRGARRLLAQAVPPIWIVEMARNTTAAFGYRPQDLIEHLRSSADYAFFAIDERTTEIVPIDAFTDEDIGANTLCVPAARRDMLRAFRTRPRRADDFRPADPSIS